MIKMNSHCILCKRITEGRFEITFMDNKTQIVKDATICKDCYNRLIEDHDNVSDSVKIPKILDILKKKRNGE